MQLAWTTSSVFRKICLTASLKRQGKVSQVIPSWVVSVYSSFSSWSNTSLYGLGRGHYSVRVHGPLLVRNMVSLTRNRKVMVQWTKKEVPGVRVSILVPSHGVGCA